MFRPLLLQFTATLCIFTFASNSLHAQDTSEPTREQLITTLKTVVDLLEKKEHDKLEKYFYLPPKFKPEMFDMLLKRNVISRDGVLALEKAGTYGTLVLLQGKRSAENTAKRFEIASSECFAMQMKQGENNCEVVAHWKDDYFKIVDINRVGKMESSKAKKKKQVVAANWPTGKAPSKKLFLDSMKVFLKYLRDENYEAAKSHVYVPEDFKVDNLKRLLEINEISEEGIQVLAKIGNFGLAKKVFEKDRLETWTGRINVAPAECYGMTAKAMAEAEVFAHWVKDHFKFIRIDDVGKLRIKEGKEKTSENTTSDK